MNFTNKNQYSVDKYLFKQANIKIDNKYKIAYCKHYYNKDNIICLQQFDSEIRLKIKTTQNVFTIETKINSNNIKQETHKTKQVIYIVVVNKIAIYTNNYKQENLNNTI